MPYDTLIDVLEERRRVEGDRLALSFLADGQELAGELTYGELFDRASAIAASLQELQALGERALLLYPAGLDFLPAFFGCLLAGVIGITAPAPEASRLKRAVPRLRNRRGCRCHLSTGHF